MKLSKFFLRAYNKTNKEYYHSDMYLSIPKFFEKMQHLSDSGCDIELQRPIDRGDKNGEALFEGDKVKFKHGEQGKETFYWVYAVVKYSGGSFYLNSTTNRISDWNYDVEERLTENLYVFENGNGRNRVYYKYYDIEKIYKCDICQFNRYMPANTTDTPYPEIYCSKGHWDIPDMGNKGQYGGDIHNDCEDYQFKPDGVGEADPSLLTGYKNK